MVAGNRAFLKLAPVARGVAATGLFAWAKAYVSSPAFTASYVKYRNDRGANEASLAATVEATTPADPRKLFARRLREFVEATADVNFSARTIALTGGPDGIEFIDPADRKKSWLWQEAVIVGPEATAAARAAAQEWLKEIER